MAVYQARVVLPYLSGLPADVAVNTFNFTAVAPPSEDLTGELVDFYNLDTDGTNTAIADFIGDIVDRTANACRIEYYEVNLATGFVGTPLAVIPFTLAAPPGGAQNLPQEVAVCTSFSAGGSPGVSPGRRRGRVYIGPLSSNAVDQGDAISLITVSELFAEVLVTATKRMVDNVIAAGAPLAVWSRVDEAAYPVVRGWVDNAFDTQRRRGVDATSRLTWMAG